MVDSWQSARGKLEDSFRRMTADDFDEHIRNDKYLWPRGQDALTRFTDSLVFLSGRLIRQISERVSFAHFDSVLRYRSTCGFGRRTELGDEAITNVYLDILSTCGDDDESPSFRLIVDFVSSKSEPATLFEVCSGDQLSPKSRSAEVRGRARRSVFHWKEGKLPHTIDHINKSSAGKIQKFLKNKKKEPSAAVVVEGEDENQA